MATKIVRLRQKHSIYPQNWGAAGSPPDVWPPRDRVWPSTISRELCQVIRVSFQQGAEVRYTRGTPGSQRNYPTLRAPAKVVLTRVHDVASFAKALQLHLSQAEIEEIVKEIYIQAGQQDLLKHWLPSHAVHEDSL